MIRFSYCLNGSIVDGKSRFIDPQSKHLYLFTETVLFRPYSLFEILCAVS